MNWIKYWWVYAVISGLALSIGGYALLAWGLRPAVDFTGGTLVEYQFDQKIDTGRMKETLASQGVEVQSVQEAASNRYVVRMSLVDEVAASELPALLGESLGVKPEQLSLSTVGPAVGKELLIKTGYAILLAAVGILIWVALAFKSFKYGLAAVLAMFHDSLVLLGSFAVLGRVLGVEVDGLYVTAVLTTLSFSVHDTIVVYDRMRELARVHPRVALRDLANRALTETMVRSLNNSLTIIFMLAALALLGGETTKWFVVALLIGTITGTYSSPFVATPLVLAWDKLVEKFRRRS